MNRNDLRALLSTGLLTTLLTAPAAAQSITDTTAAEKPVPLAGHVPSPDGAALPGVIAVGAGVLDAFTVSADEAVDSAVNERVARGVTRRIQIPANAIVHATVRAWLRGCDGNPSGVLLRDVDVLRINGSRQVSPTAAIGLDGVPAGLLVSAVDGWAVVARGRARASMGSLNGIAHAALAKLTARLSVDEGIIAWGLRRRTGAGAPRLAVLYLPTSRSARISSVDGYAVDWLATHDTFEMQNCTEVRPCPICE